MLLRKLTGIAALVAATAFSPPVVVAQADHPGVTYEDILQGLSDPSRWLTYSGDYTGGGATWMTGSYDPELNLIYWGTGNPNPDYFGDDRPGDNLFANSLVAVDADTGTLRWHYQFTPHAQRR